MSAPRPHHGGRLLAAARQYGIAPADWLDLSTGINPQPWPVPVLPPEVWQRLPEDDDGLEAAAAACYGSEALLPVAGSQAAIQALPALFARARVALLAPTYAEHPHAWTQAGHAVRHVAADGIDDAVDHSDVVLLVQPNNPDGTLFARERLLAWRERLAARGGTLVIDEAFVDATPEASVVSACGGDGLIVLRSLGKFFGLAGARVGFVFAPQPVRDALAARLGPWAVANPARHVARLALQDGDWQRAQRDRLASESARLAALLRRAGWGTVSGCALFQRVLAPDAAALHDAFARRGILLRLFEAPSALRFGLPADAVQWRRLEDAVSALSPGCRDADGAPC
jgi:cobalamin biosynthesis protein CobC